MYTPVFSLPPKVKIFSILAKNFGKQKLNFSRRALFHMKTRVCLKYFVHDCMPIKPMKINPLARIFSFISLEQRKFLINAYFLSQFGFCPLQTFADKIFKSKNKLCPEIVNKICNFKESHYSLRNSGCLISKNVRIALYGTERISRLAPKIYNAIPTEI